MPFTVHESYKPSVITFGSIYPGVELAIKPEKALQRHGEIYVITPPLASDKEIDIAVDRLKERLEVMRASAKQMLKDCQARAGKP